MSKLWAEKFDPKSNRKYYVNRETHEKKWKLPEGEWWVEKVDHRTNRNFYVNSQTRVKTWTKPGDDESPKTPESVHGEWKTKYDPNTGRNYYVNTTNFEKTWTNPNEEPLPYPWIKKHDGKSGRDFFVNTEDRSTTWRKPSEDGLPYPWKKKTDPNTNLIFYYNKETKKSQWENPLDQEKKPAKEDDNKSRNEDEDNKSRNADEDNNSRNEEEKRESDSPKGLKDSGVKERGKVGGDDGEGVAGEENPENPEDSENPEDPDNPGKPEMVEVEVEEEEEQVVQEEVPVLDENGEQVLDEDGEPVVETKEVVKTVKVKKIKTVVAQKRKKKERVKLDFIRYDWDEDVPEELWDEDDARPEQGPNEFTQLGASEPKLDTGDTTPLAPVQLGTPVPIPKSLEERRARAVKYNQLTVGQTKTGQEIPKSADKGPESSAFAGIKSGAEGREDAPIATEVLRLFGKPERDLYLPQEYRLLPYDFRYHLAGYTFSRYGRKNFTNNHPNGFMFQDKLATHPVLLHFRKAENKPLAQIAINYNVALESFAVSGAGSENSFAQSIATILDQSKEVLFGEAYCQIIRQLRNCPDKARSDRYFLALICLLYNFLPSTKLQLTVLNFLASVIERTAMNEVEDDFVKRAKRQLARTLQGKRDPKKSKKKKEAKKKEGGAEGGATSAVPVKRVGDIIALEKVGQDPQKVWDRQKDSPLLSRESIVYAQYAFFLLVQGMAHNTANVVNEAKKFGEKDVKRVVSFVKSPDVLKCSLAESLFFQSYVEPNEVKEYFKNPKAPGLIDREHNPLYFEWLTAEAQQTVPFGPVPSKKYALQLAEVPLPFTVLYLCWGIKKTGGLRSKGIFLVNEADGDIVPPLTKALAERNYAEAKKINSDDSYTYAFILQEWITNLPEPLISYTAELDALLETAPFRHESSFDNMQESHYTAAQMECQKYVKKSLAPLNLVLLKYLIRFFRYFLEPQFAFSNFLTAETLATGLATWFYGQDKDAIDAKAGGDRKSKAKDKKKDKEAAKEGGGTRTRDQKKAIYIFNLLHTVQPTEDQEQLFATLDDYARQFDNLGKPADE